MTVSGGYGLQVAAFMQVDDTKVLTTEELSNRAHQVVNWRDESSVALTNALVQAPRALAVDLRAEALPMHALTCMPSALQPVAALANTEHDSMMGGRRLVLWWRAVAAISGDGQAAAAVEAALSAVSDAVQSLALPACVLQGDATAAVAAVMHALPALQGLHLTDALGLDALEARCHGQALQAVPGKGQELTEAEAMSWGQLLRQLPAGLKALTVPAGATVGLLSPSERKPAWMPSLCSAGILQAQATGSLAESMCALVSKASGLTRLDLLCTATPTQAGALLEALPSTLAS
jgi:hypothetical protein